VFESRVGTVAVLKFELFELCAEDGMELSFFADELFRFAVTARRVTLPDCLDFFPELGFKLLALSFAAARFALYAARPALSFRFFIHVSLSVSCVALLLRTSDSVCPTRNFF